MSQTIQVNATPNELSMPTLFFSQGDVGREFQIEVVSSEGYSIPSGATVKITATKPSGFGFSVNGIVSNNTVTFTSTTEMTDEAGRFLAELEITSGSDIIGTANFYMSGEVNPHPEGTTDGSQETIIPELTLLIERAEAAANTAVEDAIEAANVKVNEILDNLPTEVTDLKNDLTYTKTALDKAVFADITSSENIIENSYINKAGDIVSFTGFNRTKPFYVAGKKILYYGYCTTMSGAYQICFFSENSIDREHFVGGVYLTNSDQYVNKYEIFDEIPQNAMYGVIVFQATRPLFAYSVDDNAYNISWKYDQSGILSVENKKQAQMNIGVDLANEVFSTLYKPISLAMETGKYIDKTGNIQDHGLFAISQPIPTFGSLFFFRGSHGKSSGSYNFNFYSSNVINSSNFINGYDMADHDFETTEPIALPVPKGAKYLVLSIRVERISRFFIDELSINTTIPEPSIIGFPYNIITGHNILMVGDSITAGQGTTGYYEWVYSEGGVDYRVRGNGPNNPYADSEYQIGRELYNESTWTWYESLDSKSYANLFKNYLTKKSIATVQNFGCSGIDSSVVLSKAQDWIDQSNCDLAFLMIGTNDRTKTLTQYTSNLKAIIDVFKSNNIEIVLISPPPASAENEETKNFTTTDIDIAMQKVAIEKGIRYIPLYQMICEYCLFRNITQDALLGDGLHPNDLGANIMFKLLCKSINLATVV